MSLTLNQLLSGAPPAIYRLRSRARPTTIAQALTQPGWRCFYLDGRAIDGKAAFLAAAAQAMQFPSYFGHNWDAFEECINGALRQGRAGRMGYRPRYSRRCSGTMACQRHAAVCAAALSAWPAAPSSMRKRLPNWAAVRGERGCGGGCNSAVRRAGDDAAIDPGISLVYLNRRSRQLDCCMKR
jgi:hypothetical protein